MNAKTDLIQIHDTDDAAVALAELHAGESCLVQGQLLTLRDDIPFGHKVALRDIQPGENIIKYGHPIGHAAVQIHRGEHLHTHNIKTNLSGTLEYTYHPKAPDASFAEKSPLMFEGYLRADGRAGVRNELWIVPTVGCVNQTAMLLAQAAKQRYGDAVEDVQAYAHNMGCSQLGDDQETTMKLLAGIIRNPNAGGVLVLSLGCENNHLERFRPYLEGADPERIRFLVTQDVEDEYTAGMELLDQLARRMEQDRRQPLSAELLTIGFKCGGSDGFSGITANPLCGRLCDRLVQAGGSAILTEVPEMFGAETLLMERCADQETFQKTVELINGYKDYFIRYQQPIYENPSPGNKAGGISTLEEKSLGCIQKGGRAPVAGVLGYGQQIQHRGLNLLTGSGNDQVSCTNLVASGATLLCFTTGRGNPFGSPVPTVKIATNHRLAEKKPHWIDFDAACVLEEGFSAGTNQLVQCILDVASGKVKTRNEEHGYKEISIFRDGVIL